MFIILRKNQLILYLLCAIAAIEVIILIITGAQNTAQAINVEETPTVYLTFDDGPSRNTAKVLDILKEEGVPGTFFVIAHTEPYELELYSRIIEEGHAMGLHSYSHDASIIYKSLDSFLDDFNKIENWVYNQTGKRPKICRIPWGTNNRFCSKKLRREILDYFNENGYACFDWDIDPLDSGERALSSERLAKSVTKQADEAPGEDVVVLLHDDYLRTTLSDALRDVISYFSEEGYRFDVLSEDLQINARRE